MIKKLFLKEYIFLFLFLAITLLNGCSFEEGTYVSDDTFRSGFSGVRLSFVDGAPPDEISENTATQVGISVNNVGAYDVEDGYITLNYDHDYLKLYSQNKKKITLEGRNKFNRDGEERAFFFDGETKFLESQSQAHEVPLIASVCYKYDSVLNDVLCIDRPYVNSVERGSKICTYSPKTYGGQGGPVGITSVKLLLSKTSGEDLLKPIFDIELSHKGDGLVSSVKSYSSACTTGSSKESMNKVFVDAYLSGKKLDCGNEEVKLVNGRARVRCVGQEIFTYAMPFKAPLSINLSYAYSESETFKFKITR